MGRTTIAALQHGVWRGDKPALEAELHPVTGEDELALTALPTGACMAERTTALLARLLVRVGDQPGGSADLARALTIGDRERLLFALHAANYEPAPELIVACSNPDCRERFEIAVPLADLIRPTGRDAAPDHVAELGQGAVRFRLPTGADQEQAALFARTDPERAGDLLFERCILALEGAGASDRTALRAALAQRLSALDPQAETILDVACPSCGAATSVSVDAATLLFGRLAGRRRLLSEIDRIARAYHWSEAEILALPVARRGADHDLIEAAEAAA